MPNKHHTNTYDGISLSSSSNNNTVSGNICSNNNGGIRLGSSSNNTIYLNNFSNSTVTNVRSSDSTNTWHLPTKLCYLYSTQTYKSYMGNYYDDYPGSDGDNNGIGDSPYDLPGDEPDDEYPLMQPTNNYNVQEYGDVNGDCNITAYDASLVLKVVVGFITMGDPNYPYLTLEIADVTDDGNVTAYDAALILQRSVGLIVLFPVENKTPHLHWQFNLKKRI